MLKKYFINLKESGPQQIRTSASMGAYQLMSEEGFEAALTRIWMGIKRPTLGHQDPASKSALSSP